MFGAADDVVRRLALSFEQEVGLADRVRLGIDVLAIKVRSDFLAVLLRELLERLLPHG